MADDLDELFAADLDEFVARRNALAKRLRAEGEQEAAAEVAALRKPTVVVWTANRLAREEAKALGRLVSASETMREALGGDAEAFERARRRHRDALAELREAAARLLAGSRGSASEQTLDRLVRTLAAASVAPEAAERLRAGRLEEEVEAAGFDSLAGLAPAPARRKGPDVAALRAEVREAKVREREAESDAAAAEREAAQARRRADELEREADAARQAADAAAQVREAAETRLRETSK